jgi:hypothetical protein
MDRTTDRPTDRSIDRTTLWLRIAIGAVGVAGVLYGAQLLFSRPSLNHPLAVIIWALASDVLVDGIILPGALMAGWVLTRTVKSRARRYVQGGLIAIGLVLPIALIEIVAKNRYPVPFLRAANGQNPAKALLTQNYTGNLVLVIAVIVAVAVTAYVLRVVRDRRR